MAIQLEDFAKQVLFGRTMEEKLSFPREEIVDTKRGEAIKTPRTLSRPSHLVLRENGVKASHPSQAKLVDEKERGRLLHFFGNHELLATELMALAILKFPEAPTSFRRGLLETLKDEQMHTQLYLHRMRQCGVEFGELPLSDYFWRSVSSMEDPLDYVTRLSLTFEQANLDYSREYGKIFETVGDSATANILDKIYRDEIDHVGFGLKWFRRWKAEGKTDWEAFRERLVFPLSPARAKGNFFNRQGRSEAGLDSSFIKDLEVFSQSRGRTPFVYWFNPDAERFAAQDSAAGFDAKALSAVQRDLEFLPAFLSRRDDVLLMQERPSAAFLKSLKAAGMELPEIYCYQPNERSKAPALKRKLGGIRPWAWTPDSVAFLSELFARVTRPRKVDTLWNERVRELHSKAWGARWAAAFLEEGEPCDWIVGGEVLGQTAETLEEVTRLREAFAEQSYPSVALKAPFGTAANGMRRLLAGEAVSGALVPWIEQVLREQGSLVVEPWLDRVYDFSIQLEMREEGLRVLGYTRLLNNARGQFRGIVTNGFCQGLDPELVKFIMQRVEGRPRLYHWYEETLLPALEKSLLEIGFQGPMGIDAFIFRDGAGRLLLKPVVEFNPRYTMGRVALELGQRNAATSVGFFEVVSKAQVKKRFGSSLAEWGERCLEACPLRLSEEKRPRIVEGSLLLNDPQQARQFLAAYHVRTSLEELPL
ncbi:DUF455 family protein [Pelagicoccus sp. SDUM812005]|uniref:DUF455 family protein n=1 Tax=Pelagicoccus sp. SDUM812005 TaxID=3041257 RepID=UPI00280E6457|nr:DUF455 family protein [Pelagicoccus sp. SDUM812005]MDQ8179544.1 DUF455 family protein [Pelagicoccus sp. SDUM812005]